MVSLDEIGTDATLANAYKADPAYSDWYNSSWYGQGADAGDLNPQDGYVAPPLDGIWATAPYLHNGSVPSVAMMLQSTKRPTYWKRGFTNDDYDQAELGWTYTSAATRTDFSYYDTTVVGYGNTGHTFGDALTDDERNAVIEYLKTL